MNVLNSSELRGQLRDVSPSNVAELAAVVLGVATLLAPSSPGPADAGRAR